MDKEEMRLGLPNLRQLIVRILRCVRWSQRQYLEVYKYVYLCNDLHYIAHAIPPCMKEN